MAVVIAVASAVTGCVTYEPAPVDVYQVLAGLEARNWEPFAGPRAEPEGAGPEQLAAFAVTHNPSLDAARAQIGVAEALLVEAGLLANPQIGWDGMEALASQLVRGTTSTVDFVSGFGLSIPLPRPGELDAKEGAARWQVERTRRKLVQAEWLLTEKVFVATAGVLEAQRLLEQSQELLEVVESTHDYFARAMAAGTATAIQASLALGDLLAIQAQRIRLEGNLRDARHQLNALLGLPPASEVPVVAPPEAAPDEAPLDDPDALVAGALSHRPDLAALMAAYQVAEAKVRLEVARQLPEVAIGTGLWLVPGLFTHFNRPVIATAMARRAALREEIEARVHEVRRDVRDAIAAVQEMRRELAFLETELLPNAEKSLRLAGAAFDAGAVTLVEILTLQRALVDARTRITKARFELMRRRWRLLAASGLLLARNDPGGPEPPEILER